MEFKLAGEEFITLQALLKVCGLAQNGGAAKSAITSGAGKVDGEIETRRGKKIRAGQIVFFENQQIQVIA